LGSGGVRARSLLVDLDPTPAMVLRQLPVKERTNSRDVPAEAAG